VVLRDVETFTLAMECVDRLLDGIADPRARRAFGDAVMAALEESAPPGTACSPDFTPELEARLFALPELLPRRRMGERFCQWARQALSNTALIRTTGCRRQFVAAVEIEGRLTVELTLTLLEGHSTEAFVGFLRSLAELCNLADKLLDARGDFERGEMACRPGLGLHALLAVALLRRLPGAARRHPRLGGFGTWGLGYL